MGEMTPTKTFLCTRPQSPKTTKISTSDQSAMAKKSFLTSLKAKKVWLKPPMLPAQKVTKLKAVNTLQIGETSALDGDDEDEVDDPPDQSLMMLTRMTTKKKTRPKLKKNNKKDEKIADEVEVEDEVEAEEEVEEEAEDEVVI